MNIRRDRTHNCGLTNLDYRTKGEVESVDRYHPSLKFADFGTMGKSQYKRMTSAADFKEQIKLTGGFKTMTNLNPRYETAQDFYKTQGKKIKMPAQIGKRKEQELEDPQWTDKVFTGDNPKLTAFLSGMARDRENLFNADYKKRRLWEAQKDQFGSPTKLKEDIHAEAEQETQLVRMKNNATLEGNVDLAKVKDIRRALRRRYATRSNFQKIFTQWDSSGKGNIDVEDIHKMMNKMGLKVNFDEAQVLLISADQNQDNVLHMNEFIDLIFSNNDALNVDLSKVERVQPREELFKKEIDAQNYLLQDIRKDAESLKQIRATNQWKLFIQKNLNNISLDLLNMDPQKSYQIDHKDLFKVLERRMKVPEYLKQNVDNLMEFVGEYSDSNNPGKVNYRDMIEDLRTFNYDQATNERVGIKTSASVKTATSGNSDLLNQVGRKTKTIFDDEYTILDSQKVPPNTLEQIHNKLVKVNRHLKKVFGSQAELENAIKENFKIDSNGNISVDQLKQFVLANCKDEMINKKLNKRDIEGFLSSFIYNAYGSTNSNDLASLVFTDDNYVAKKLSTRTRPNPPPPEVNGDLDLYEVNEDGIHNYRVKEVLQKLEEKVFIGPTKMFQVFKQFDKDGDGFVSYADFEDQINNLQIPASKQEIAGILKFLDKDNKGYLDFKTFSTTIQPNMSSNINIQRNELHLPNLAPNRAKISEYGTRSTSIRSAFAENRKTFSPDHEQKLMAPTRFTAKPPPPNTFLNFQPGPKTPGFIGESERFVQRDLNSTVGFQKLDKDKKQSLVMARTEVKKNNMENLLTKVNELEIKKETFHQNKIYKKAANQEMYERLCHIQSL